MTGATPAARVVGHSPASEVTVIEVTAQGEEISRQVLTRADFAPYSASIGDSARWVWNDTTQWYPELLSHAVRVDRAHDVRLCHAILRDSAFVTQAQELRAAAAWDLAPAQARSPEETLFSFEADVAPALPDNVEEVLAEYQRQLIAVRRSPESARLRMLLAAESAGALVAVEMNTAGLPWSRAVHESILVGELGERPRPGALPSRIERLASEVRIHLGDPGASLDSQPKLLRALHRVGVLAESTSRWELAEYDHPVIAPLLAYKKMMRLLTANGWAWLEEWAPDGRFRPVYVPGGVVTGRWASSGGGALQLPRQLRPAVRADEGWTFVVADVAQLEPRALAAMARDEQLAAAARGKDLYEGIVSGGVVSTRQEAKFAVLGAMYGATTGDSGRLVPALRRAYPRAMGLVDAAARTGEEGGVVSTWLGRSCPPPSPAWRALQARASDADAGEQERTVARRTAKDRGRFTRNFVVQGTAAEWALAWLADLRLRLASLPAIGSGDVAATASGPAFQRRAHLAFFLHDEIIVHTPMSLADRVADAVSAAADNAALAMFGGFPLDFRLDLKITQDAAKA